jgi:hypothetical protein
MDNKKKSFGYFIGQVTGGIIVACGAVCIGGLAIALTVKLIMLLF